VGEHYNDEFDPGEEQERSKSVGRFDDLSTGLYRVDLVYDPFDLVGVVRSVRGEDEDQWPLLGR